MALTGSGTISMGNMRTEFSISGAISMSDLYRGGSEVPSTATTTVGASVANLTGSAVSIQNGDASFGHKFSQSSRFTSNMTCGNNGNVTASSNIVFVANGSGAGDNASLMPISAGVRIVSTDATANAAGTLTGGTEYRDFTGSTTSAVFSCSSTTTIPSGTDLQIPSGTTSFKILTYIAVSKSPRSNDGECSASTSLNNPSSGAFTSTTTDNVNTGVPASGTISFSDLYGAVG